MKGFRNRFLGLCLAPIALCVTDNALTLCGQSQQYWAGDHSHVNEGSPVFHGLLQIHPAVFAAGGLAWIASFVVVIMLLPDTPALIVSIAVTFGHAAGAATWLLYHYGLSYQACNGLFLASAVLLGVSIRYGWRAVPETPFRCRRLPWFVRWSLIALLTAGGLYVHLWAS